MKKGFTLLELLSVIIILAVITLIAVPIVSGVVTKVKLGALKSSAYGLLEASDLYYARYNNTSSLRFDIDENVVSSNDTTNLLSYKGEVKEGTVIINKKGETTICITDGTNSVYKNYRDKHVIEAANKKCNIPSSTYVVYLDDQATLSELSNQELTELLRQLQEQMDSKADRTDLEVVSTVASNAATLNTVYPVGSIYVSTNSTSPATLFGGSWERIQDKFLLSAGSSYTAGSTGGSTSHTLTLSEMPYHNHSIPSLSGTALTAGTHTHTYNGSQHGWDVAGSATGMYFGSSTTTNPGYEYGINSAGAHTHSVTTNSSSTGYTGGSNGTTQSFSTMPPYLTVYVWKRTA